MVNVMGNMVRAGRIVAEFIHFDNGKVVIAWAPFPEENRIPGLSIFDSMEDCRSIYKAEEFRVLFRRRARKRVILVILRGLPGSGKSCWVGANRFQKITYRRDERRAKLFPGQDFTATIAAMIDQDEIELVGKMLDELPVVITDGTHLNRERYFRLVKALQATRDNILIVPVMFPVTLEEAIRRQSGRPEQERVPEAAIRKMQQDTQDWPAPLDDLEPIKAAMLIKDNLEVE